MLFGFEQIPVTVGIRFKQLCKGIHGGLVNVYAAGASEGREVLVILQALFNLT